MKTFNTFKSAIEYYPHCPLCQNELKINDRDLAADLGSSYRDGKDTISFFIDNGNDTLTIDPETEEVEFILGKKFVCNPPSSMFNSILSQPSYNGKFAHKLSIDCQSCCKFCFTLQVHVNLTSRKLEPTILNSESISIEEGNMVHEIKNNYIAKQTHYAYFSKDGDSKRTQLPLIGLNLNNPKETVARIRKLLIFS